MELFNFQNHLKIVLMEVVRYEIVIEVFAFGT